jgi:hypothetical protein
MPWATLKARPITELTVIPDDGKRYVVTFHGGEAYLPLPIYNYLIREHLAIRADKPDLKPQFERLAGGVNGKMLDPFASYVREVAS